MPMPRLDVDQFAHQIVQAAGPGRGEGDAPGFRAGDEIANVLVGEFTATEITIG